MGDHFGDETHASNMMDQEILENPDESPGLTLDTSLFGEKVTEAELMGGDPPDDDKDSDDDSNDDDKATVDNKSGSADPTGKDDDAADDKDGDDKDEGDKDDKDGSDEGDPKKTTPPEGYVSVKALHRERDARKSLQQEVSELRDALENQVEDKNKDYEPESSLKKGFKVLTKEEYETLSDEDPVAAMQYRLDFQEFKANERAVQERQASIKTNIQKGYEKVLDALPEIADEDNTIADDIEDFADGFGIDSKVFLEMANPSTMVVDSNGQARPLGTAAADFLLLLHGVMKKTSSMKSETEATLRKEIEAELVKKFKEEKSSNFKSIEDAPSTGNEPEGGSAPLSEAEFMKLSPKERQELLMGAPGI